MIFILWLLVILYMGQWARKRSAKQFDKEKFDDLSFALKHFKDKAGVSYLYSLIY